MPESSFCVRVVDTHNAAHKFRAKDTASNRSTDGDRIVHGAGMIGD